MQFLVFCFFKMKHQGFSVIQLLKKTKKQPPSPLRTKAVVELSNRYELAH